MNKSSDNYSMETWQVVWNQVGSYGVPTLAFAGLLSTTVMVAVLCRFRCRQPDVGAASALFYMCVVDLVCLLSLICFMQLGQPIVASPAVPPFIKTTFCKGHLFVIHTASIFSVWCWMVMSGLRLLAVLAPIRYYQSRLLRRPARLLCLLLGGCVLLEGRRLLLMEYSPHRHICVPNPRLSLTFLRLSDLVEILCNFVLPVALTVVMDVGLLRLAPSMNRRLDNCVSMEQMDLSKEVSFAAQNLLRLHRQREQKRQRMIKRFQRYLLLANLDLLLNTPMAAARLASANGVRLFDSTAGVLFGGTSLLLWYAQFCVNALHIWALVGPGGGGDGGADGDGESATTVGLTTAGGSLFGGRHRRRRRQQQGTTAGASPPPRRRRFPNGRRPMRLSRSVSDDVQRQLCVMQSTVASTVFADTHSEIVLL